MLDHLQQPKQQPQKHCLHNSVAGTSHRDVWTVVLLSAASAAGCAAAICVAASFAGTLHEAGRAEGLVLLAGQGRLAKAEPAHSGPHARQMTATECHAASAAGYQGD